MIKEKVTALIKKEDKSNKKKIENLIFAFALLVITLIALNFIFKDDNKKEKANVIEISNNTSTNQNNNVNKDTEKELESILSQIKGVEAVKVLITYSETEKLVPLYNESSSQSTTEEKDTEGGVRTIENYDTNKEVISDANQNPITEKIILPKMEGAVVIARGAANTQVKENIINAVEAATGLAVHKIQVFEMK